MNWYNFYGNLVKIIFMIIIISIILYSILLLDYLYFNQLNQFIWFNDFEYNYIEMPLNYLIFRY
jgi:hypothetical protein